MHDFDSVYLFGKIGILIQWKRLALKTNCRGFIKYWKVIYNSELKSIAISKNDKVKKNMIILKTLHYARLSWAWWVSSSVDSTWLDKQRVIWDLRMLFSAKSTQLDKPRDISGLRVLSPVDATLLDKPHVILGLRMLSPVDVAPSLIKHALFQVYECYLQYR